MSESAPIPSVQKTALSTKPKKRGPAVGSARTRDADTGLTPLQEKVIPYLLSTANYRQAGLAAGCSETTVSQWMMDDPKFRKAVHNARKEAYSHTLWCAQEAAAEALQVLREAMKHKDARVRVSAAKEIIAMAKAGYEGLELESRIALLEQSAIQPQSPTSAP